MCQRETSDGPLIAPKHCECWPRTHVFQPETDTNAGWICSKCDAGLENDY